MISAEDHYLDDLRDRLEEGYRLIPVERMLVVMWLSPEDRGAGGVIARLERSGDVVRDLKKIRQAKHNNERARALWFAWTRHRKTCLKCPDGQCSEGVRLYTSWHRAELDSLRFKMPEIDNETPQTLPARP